MKVHDVLVGGLGVAYVVMLWANLGPGAVTRPAAAERLRVARGAQTIQSELLDLDALYRKSAPEGNVFLLFKDFEADEVGDQQWALMHYFRASYALYPRRVYVCADDQLLVSGNHLLSVNERPPNRWLQRHDVRTVMTNQEDGPTIVERLTP